MGDKLLEVKKVVLKSVEEKRGEILGLLRELVQTPSVTGSEREVQEKISQKLEQMDLKVDVWCPSIDELKEHKAYNPLDTDYKDRPNVVGLYKGVGGGRSLILNGHADVVAPNDQKWTYDPWSAKVVDGKVYGRGACDMKGGLTSIIMALKCIKDANVELLGDVIIESVIGEETGGNGTLACIMRGYKADAGIVAEPTGLEIHTMQSGALWFRISVIGRAAHGAFRKAGISALEKIVKIYETLLEFENKRMKELRHPLYEEKYGMLPVYVNIGVLRAGEWPSTVPDRAFLEGRVGLLPEEDCDVIKGQVEELIMKVSSEDSWLKENPPKIEWLGRWDPAKIDISHPLVSTVKEAYTTITGKEAVLGGTVGGTDMRLLTLYGDTPSILFGPGNIDLAHTADEYIDLEDVITATKVIACTIVDWCGVDI